jgi:hypothetical protein
MNNSMPIPESNEQTIQATWWTPEGFIARRTYPCPEPYNIAFSLSDECNHNWSEMLKKAGYEKVGHRDNNLLNSLRLDVWEHQTHLYVEVWGEFQSLTNFFVPREHSSAFSS